jgi:hypothetical protein
MDVHRARQRRLRKLAELLPDPLVARFGGDRRVLVDHDRSGYGDHRGAGVERQLTNGPPGLPHLPIQLVHGVAGWRGGLDLLQEQLGLDTGLVELVQVDPLLGLGLRLGPGPQGSLRHGGEPAGLGIDQHQLFLDAHGSRCHITRCPGSAAPMPPATL